MAFHEAFWVVTGTAAPITALAAAVALNDASAAVTRIVNALVEEGIGSDEEPADFLPQSFRLAASIWLTQMLNVVVQALSLAISLLSIAFQRNVIAPWVAAAMPVAGVLAIAVAGVGVQRARARIQVDIRRAIEREAPSDA